MELAGCLLQHCQYSSFMLHQCRQILRDRPTAGLSVNHDEHEAGNHVERRVVFPNYYELPTDLRGMVYHEGAPGIQAGLSRCLCISSQQALRHH